MTFSFELHFYIFLFIKKIKFCLSKDIYNVLPIPSEICVLESNIFYSRMSPCTASLCLEYGITTLMHLHHHYIVQIEWTNLIHSNTDNPIYKIENRFFFHMICPDHSPPPFHSSNLLPIIPPLKILSTVFIQKGSGI